MKNIIEQILTQKQKRGKNMKKAVIGRIEEFAIYGMFLLFLIKAFTFAVGIDLW
jgi:hypothetical protein